MEKGTLTVFGVSISDGGNASAFEGIKGTISDTLKRCGVMRGWAVISMICLRSGSPRTKGKIPEATLKQLQSRLAACRQEKKAS